MTKIELLNCIIDMTRKTGQGLSTAIIGMKLDIKDHIDELLEEGKIVTHRSEYGGPGITHDVWAMPANCYNVWADKEGERMALSYVRFYLDSDDVGFGITRKMLLQNVDFISGYASWLKKNGKSLEDMVNLKNIEEIYSNVVLTEEELIWVKSRGWYTDNSTIKECLDSSIGALDDSEQLSINKRLLELYNTNDSYRKEYADKIKESEDFINNAPKLKRIRKKVNTWMEEQDSQKKIQELI